MRQRKSKKILFYLFLLIIVGSVNNYSIKDIKWEKIQYINISGLNSFYEEKILKDLSDLKLENIFFLKEKDFTEVLDSNTLIEKYNILKKYPSTLDIQIQETVLIAEINKKGKIFYIGENGKLSEKKFSDKELPFIFGKPSIEEFLKLKKNIDQSKFSFQDIKNLYFFPSGRWDIELNNKIVLKLPKENTKKSLDEIFRFLKNNNINNIKTVDARVKNQIILNDRRK